MKKNSSLKNRRKSKKKSKMKDFFNPCGESDQLIVQVNFAKNGWAKRSKKREAKLRVKNKNWNILTRSFASRF